MATSFSINSASLISKAFLMGMVKSLTGMMPILMGTMPIKAGSMKILTGSRPIRVGTENISIGTPPIKVGMKNILIGMMINDIAVGKIVTVGQNIWDYLKEIYVWQTTNNEY
jgi:hypothetical protein